MRMLSMRVRSTAVRSAYTLIEIIIVISILVLLMSLVSGVVFRIWRTSTERMEKQNWKSMHELGKPARRSKPIRVLFIGNSYTFANDLPRLTVALAEADGESPELEVDTHVVG